jgi:hypothetical protein
MNWQYLQFPVEEHVLKAKFINAQNASQYMDQVFTGALPRAGFVRDITKYIAVSYNGTRSGHNPVANLPAHNRLYLHYMCVEQNLMNEKTGTKLYHNEPRSEAHSRRWFAQLSRTGSPFKDCMHAMAAMLTT